MSRLKSTPLLTIVATLFCTPVWAQSPLPVASPQVAIEKIQKVAEDHETQAQDLALGSPRATMDTFLKAIDQLWEDPGAGWDDAVSTMDLGPDQIENGHEHARMLYGIMNRIGRVDVDDLPDDEDVQEDKLTVFRFFPNRDRQHRVLTQMESPPAGSIRLKPDEDGHWRFDRDTMDVIPALFKQMKPLPIVSGKRVLTVSDYIRGSLPRSLTDYTFLTLAYWQWLAIALLVVTGLLIDLVLRLLLRRIERHFAVEPARAHLRRGLRPVGQMGALLVWWVTVQFLEIQGLVGEVLSATLAILLAMIGTVAAWRITDLIGYYLSTHARHSPGHIDDVLVPLVVRALKVMIVVVAVVFAAGALNLPLAPLLASLTIAGVAFSFAAKDTVENFFGSVAVLTDRPFDMGDWVVIDDVEGMVEQVGFRSTRVRTFYNSVVTIPNANLVRAIVDNYGRRRYRRWKTTLGVQYDTTPEQLVGFTEGIRELVRLHPYTRKDYYEVYCNDFGDSSLNILLYLFFEVPDWNTELRERERMFLDIVRLADQLGVQFAFPTQTVHLFSGETPSAPSNQPPGHDTEIRETLRGARMAQRIVAEQPWSKTKPGPVQITTHRTEIQLDDAGNPVIEEKPDS